MKVYIDIANIAMKPQASTNLNWKVGEGPWTVYRQCQANISVIL